MRTRLLIVSAAAATAVGAVVLSGWAFGSSIGPSSPLALPPLPVTTAAPSAPAAPTTSAPTPSATPTTPAAVVVVPAATGRAATATRRATQRATTRAAQQSTAVVGDATAGNTTATDTGGNVEVGDSARMCTDPVDCPTTSGDGSTVRIQLPNEVIGRAITCSDGGVGYVTDADLDTDCALPADQRAKDAPAAQ